MAGTRPVPFFKRLTTPWSGRHSPCFVLQSSSAMGTSILERRAVVPKMTTPAVRNKVQHQGFLCLKDMECYGGANKYKENLKAL